MSKDVRDRVADGRGGSGDGSGLGEDEELIRPFTRTAFGVLAHKKRELQKEIYIQWRTCGVSKV